MSAQTPAERNAMVFVRPRGDGVWVVYPRNMQKVIQNAHLAGKGAISIYLAQDRRIDIDLIENREIRINPRRNVKPIVRLIKSVIMKESNKDAEISFQEGLNLLENDISDDYVEPSFEPSQSDDSFKSPSLITSHSMNRSPRRGTTRWLSNMPFSSAPVTPVQPAARATRVIPKPLETPDFIFEYAYLDADGKPYNWRRFEDKDSSTLSKLVALNPPGRQMVILDGHSYYVDVKNRIIAPISANNEGNILFRYYERVYR